MFNIFVHLSDQGQLYEEAGYTDDEDKDLVRHWCTKQLRKQVTYRGDKTLYCHKLGTK